MKRLLLSLNVLLGAALFAQTGYEIKVTLKPFKKQYIYLGHYFGKTYPIIDSVMLNDKSEGVFKGNKKLNGGIYLVGYPGRNGFFEILVDKQQRFSIIADTATISKGAAFIGSPDNTLFTSYQQRMTASGKQIKAEQDKLKTASAEDSVKIRAELERLDKEVTTYRENIIKNNPSSLLSTLLVAMREPVLTGRLKEPQNKTDSLDALNFYKGNYWKGVNFWDGRLAYTTFFEDKIDKYFSQLVMPQQDSLIKEMDYMLGFASVNEEMSRFLLIKFVNRYLNMKYMWDDIVYVHLYEKYFSQKNYSWLNEQGRKVIDNHYYSVVMNVLGNPAADIELPDTSGKATSLYELKADYTVLVFWDPTCGHCKEILPKIDSMYQAKWKAGGLKVFTVAKETDGSKKDWTTVINTNNLQEWTNVYYSKAEDKARTDSGVPGYSQLYDINIFPTIYLLDKEKRIIAKKLTYQQVDEIWQLKVKGQ